MSTAARPQSYDLLRRLVGFDTTSRESNLALIHFVRDHLAELGVESRLVHDATGAKANLYARLGPPEGEGVMLSGHTDVVPVDGQDWSTAPFDASESGGRLYGRGTADMKGFIACVLALAPEMLRRGLQAPVHLAFSYDEEVGCIGVRRLIDQLAGLGARPRACFVGEPTSMAVARAHKGIMGMRCRVHGAEAHSSLTHQGVNAIEAAAEVIAHLKGMARRFRDEGPWDPLFDPPYTTVNTGLIEGGTALNIVANACSFLWESRCIPAQDPREIAAELRRFAEERLLPEMRAVSAAAGFDWEERAFVPGLATDEDSPATQLALQLTGANGTGSVSYATEAGLFTEAGIPTIVCGPGSIEQAHKPDEWIALEQLDECEVFLGRLMDRMCAHA